jgi:hypothetical protein
MCRAWPGYLELWQFAVMRRVTSNRLAVSTLLLLGLFEIRASERSEPRMTILVHDYVGLDDKTLRQAEEEANRIFRHAGLAVNWQGCDPSPALRSENCPNVGPLTLELRLLLRLPLIPDHVRINAAGYAGAGTMTVSWKRAETLALASSTQTTQILGVLIAHEFGHLLLGKSHSVSGVMRAELRFGDLALASKGWLIFHPSEAEALRLEVLRRALAERAVADAKAFDMDTAPPQR